MGSEQHGNKAFPEVRPRLFTGQKLCQAFLCLHLQFEFDFCPLTLSIGLKRVCYPEVTIPTSHLLREPFVTMTV